MAASVLFACGLNEQKLPSFVHISEESQVDGSFLISCILGQRLRISNAGALLICLQNNYQHYFHAGMRLGYNTNIFLNKTLSVIDPLTEMAHDIINSPWLSNDKKSVCHLLLEGIQEHITQNENFQKRSSNTILIDNLSVLFNLGATKEDVIQFCHELAGLPGQHENLTIITKMNNCDIYSLTDNNVSKLGDLRIRVIKLKSGVFREVDGKLLIEKDLEDSGDFMLQQSKKEILYKVNDRNIKIFNPGEIGVKV